MRRYIQRTCSILVPEPEPGVFSFTLIVAKWVMFCHIIETQRLAVFGEAEEGPEKGGVQGDVATNLDVLTGWGGWTVDHVLDCEVLEDLNLEVRGRTGRV